MTTKVMNGLDLQSQRIQALADPSSATDAATKQYVDNLINGLSWKSQVRAATTTNGTLATAFANGQTIDGVTLVTGNRILIKNQTTQTENGIYVVAASGAPTRAVDADSAAELVNATVYVSEGTTLADTAWTQTTNAPITVGSSNLVWAQVGGSSGFTVAGNGLTSSGGTVDVVGGTGIVANANDVAIDTAVVVRKFAVTIGDGSTTAIAVTHNLGTRDITWQCYDATTFADVLVDAVRTSTNVLTLTFAVAPAASAYRVVVQA